MGDYDHMGNAFNGLIRGVGCLFSAFVVALGAAITFFVLWLIKA